MKEICAMLKKESKMAVRVNPNGPTRSRALLPPAMLGLGLLAAMAGQASAELGCKTYNNSGDSYLIDAEYCHSQELNAAFDGLLTGCSSRDGRVRRMCSQMCTHHHPPTPTHTHSVGRACAASPTPPLLPRLSFPSSLCVNGKHKRKRDCDTARLSWPWDEWHHSAPAFRHAWLLHEAEIHAHLDATDLHLFKRILI